MNFKKISSEYPYFLLLAADPSKEMIDLYLKDNLCFGYFYNDKCISVMVLSPISSDEIEIKNISVDVNFQKKGIAKQLILEAENISKSLDYKMLRICTGNSSIHQLNLYQQCHFEIKSIIENFFIDHYDQDIFEHDIHCKHLIILKKEL